MTDTPRTRAPWQVWFVLLSAIWGMSFLFIKVADESLAPVQVALGRMAFGLATVVGILVVRRVRLPSGARTWGHLAAASLLLNALPFTLFAYGETHISSVLAGIFNAATPLFVVSTAAVLVPGERLSGTRLTGVAVGFLGVITVFGIWRGLGRAGLEGDLLCLAAAASYGLGFPYARRFLNGRADPLPLAAGQLLCGTVLLAVVTPLISGAPAGLPTRVVAAVAALGVLGTGLAFVLNFTLIRDAGATVASTVAYVMPVFSTLAGVLVLGEPLSWNEPVGAAIILAAALVAQGRLKLPRREPPLLKKPRLSLASTESIDRSDELTPESFTLEMHPPEQ